MSDKAGKHKRKKGEMEIFKDGEKETIFGKKQALSRGISADDLGEHRVGVGLHRR